VKEGNARVKASEQITMPSLTVGLLTLYSRFIAICVSPRGSDKLSLKSTVTSGLFNQMKLKDVVALMQFDL
jgi:hypothetical protein